MHLNRKVVVETGVPTYVRLLRGLRMVSLWMQSQIFDRTKMAEEHRVSSPC